MVSWGSVTFEVPGILGCEREIKLAMVTLPEKDLEGRIILGFTGRLHAEWLH